MITPRLRAEVEALRTQYTVQWALPLGGILLTDFRYPVGWYPQQAPLLIQVPETYPTEQPTICIPARLRYTKGRVKHRVSHPADGWVQWCIHRLTWDPHDWDIPKLLTLTMASLNHPTKTDPFEHTEYDV